MGAPDLWNLFLFLAALGLVCLALLFYWLAWTRRPLRLHRMAQNPVLSPDPGAWWESEAVFNPAAVYDNGKVHLFYRALWRDGISRVGYASSDDGIHFERLPYPVYDAGAGFTIPDPRRRYAPLSYSPALYASGGGWGGTEDPRAVIIEDRLYMNLSTFEAWESIRMALTSLPREDLHAGRWSWKRPFFISPPGETHKNWVLFPEKIRGKFALLHALTPKPTVEYVDDLDELEREPVKSNNRRGGREGRWDAFVRGASAPPIKTPHGWLLFYHGMDPKESHIGYKVGAMLLELDDPSKVLFRSAYPVLEPEAWYEHDWKPHVVYASGAVVVGNDLIVYYGGGDKHVAAARADFRDFVRKLMTGDHATLEPVRV